MTKRENPYTFVAEICEELDPNGGTGILLEGPAHLDKLLLARLATAARLGRGANGRGVVCRGLARGGSRHGLG